MHYARTHHTRDTKGGCTKLHKKKWKSNFSCSLCSHLPPWGPLPVSPRHTPNHSYLGRMLALAVDSLEGERLKVKERMGGRQRKSTNRSCARMPRFALAASPAGQQRSLPAKLGRDSRASATRQHPHSPHRPERFLVRKSRNARSPYGCWWAIAGEVGQRGGVSEKRGERGLWLPLALCRTIGRACVGSFAAKCLPLFG